MGRKRQFPYVWMDAPWSGERILTRGLRDGLPLFSYGLAGRARLATRRQLRTRRLRPGGADPVGVLYLHCRHARKHMFCDLFDVDQARPVRPMTPAKWAAVEAALAARRTCPECGSYGLDYIPRSTGVCEGCEFRAGLWHPLDPRHEMVPGMETVNPEEI